MTENKQKSSRNLLEVLQESLPESFEEAAKLMDKYEKILLTSGFDSSEASDFYLKTVVENEFLKEWLDAVYRLASCRDFPVNNSYRM